MDENQESEMISILNFEQKKVNKKHKILNLSWQYFLADISDSPSRNLVLVQLSKCIVVTSHSDVVTGKEYSDSFPHFSCNFCMSWLRKINSFSEVNHSLTAAYSLSFIVLSKYLEKKRSNFKKF